ncbi:M15 family metallopeptidase [Comamonas kerstersii]|uniref:M15 family metallopeptidase n=1 Tax=Comamonas kerstersii TaxID=225992 RepID=UPI00266FA9AE|nr:M15 family metallopeptidase [Comamonas kerstersii]
MSTLTLGQKQRLFTKLVAQLIQYAYAQGYELTLGDAYRDPRVHGDVGVKKSYSSANSVHKQRLAIDLNLFKDGQYLTTTEAHKPLGQFWKSLHPLCRWGGDFSTPDGNHYSMAHEGRA